MSYLQVTSFQPSLHVQNKYKKHCGSHIQCVAPLRIFNAHSALKLVIPPSKKCTQRTGASRYQQCRPLCLFGGKGDPKNDNEASPWKSIEMAMSSFKKEQSLEDVLRQQMEKQEYYDGGSGGNPPTGGGGGGGFGESEDEGFAGILDDILQVTLAILALIVLYLYIIAGDQVMFFITDTFDFLLGKKGPRIRSIMYDFAKFYEKFRAKVPYDPYWLEKAIITTPTLYDSPEKYQRIIKRALKSSKQEFDSDSDSDNKAYNINDEDSDDDNAYGNKAYDDDDDDDNQNAYSEDVDEDY